MKKLTLKQKKWQIKRSRKEIKKRQKRNAYRRQIATGISFQNQTDTQSIMHSGKTIVHAPNILSVFDNTIETLSFFNHVSTTIKTLKLHGKLYFDLSKVDIVSVDAIMYLIAMIKNTKRIKSLKIECSGNMPLNADARRIFETSGFYKYLSPQYSIKCSTLDEQINITQGREAIPTLAGDICAFVHRKCSCNILDTKSLYSMMLELMTNTKQHAYTNNNNMDNNWYVFVEDCDSYMNFIFLDTGEGIPNTIRTKGVLEKIKNIFNSEDAFFIASALRGELRSETKLEYRGKGLPEIYKRASRGYIRDLSVISGYGKCAITQKGEIVETKLSDCLIGTMFNWKFFKTPKEN